MTIAGNLNDRIAEFVPPEPDGSMHFYLGTYQKFRDIFDRLTFTQDNRADADFCVWLTASWMRLQQDGHWNNYMLGLNNYETARPVLQKAREGRSLIFPDELEVIKSYVGGSMVAASKFLHFVQPERFAMWDRNVWMAISGKPKRSFQDCAKAYSCYLGHLSELALPQRLDEQLQQLLGEVTLLRRKEFVLFCLGKAGV